MLNSEGVQNGLTRTDLLGKNLNDSYDQADYTTPSILLVKKLVKSFRMHRNLIILDIHSHFTHRGRFIFGKRLLRNNYQQVLSFPYILYGSSKDFSIRNSQFGSNLGESTSRYLLS